MLGSVLELQELEIGLPQRERPTEEEFDQVGKGAYWARRPRPNSTEPAEPVSSRSYWTQGPARRQTAPARAPQKANEPTVSDLPWAWTGRDAPVGQLMHLAITDPKEFCALVHAALPRPTAQQRGLAARRAWEERQRAGKRRRAEQESRVTS